MAKSIPHKFIGQVKDKASRLLHGEEPERRYLHRGEAEQDAAPAAAPEAPAPETRTVSDEAEMSPEARQLQELVVARLREVYDPEIPVNIYDLGLIYRIGIDTDARRAEVDMTLTAPGCPVAQTFPGTVENAVKSVEGIDDAHVELVWDPPWTKDRMSEAARLQLGFF